jgi:hypothetical protein
MKATIKRSAETLRITTRILFRKSRNPSGSVRTRYITAGSTRRDAATKALIPSPKKVTFGSRDKTADNITARENAVYPMNSKREIECHVRVRSAFKMYAVRAIAVAVIIAK